MTDGLVRQGGAPIVRPRGFARDGRRAVGPQQPSVFDIDKDPAGSNNLLAGGSPDAVAIADRLRDLGEKSAIVLETGAGLPVRVA